MLEITNFRQGAVLNHNHGQEDSHSLTVHIEGVSNGGFPVEVAGQPAQMEGRRFFADIALDKKINQVTASVMTPYGKYSQELTLVWDKKSFKRCNFYIDDHIFFLTDLAKERPRRAFDHFYLAGLKKIHDSLGLKVTLNCFYRNDHHAFTMDKVPDIWKQEFIDNSDWLKLSFHSYSEFPDRPYLESNAEEFGRDYDLIKNEIFRFAGEETFIPPVVIHWANVHPAVAAEYIRRGSRCYSTSFRARVMGGPSLADRQKGGNMSVVEKRSMSGEDRGIPTEALKLHYEFQEEQSYMAKHFVRYDPGLDCFFFGGGGCCCNLTPLAEIPAKLARNFETADKYGVEVCNSASHEQYTFPYYPNYIPDHLERIEAATRAMVENWGAKPVFFNDGILGNTAWD